MILVPPAMEQAIRILEERLASEEREHIRWALEQALAAMRKQIYYVVLRSEEHADYVERLYKDRGKAEEYCRQFEGNEDEYGRDIVEIELSE